MRYALSLSAAAVTLVAVAALAQTAPQMSRLNAAETELTAGQALTQGQLARLLSVLQQLSRDPPPALLVSPEDARRAVRAAILVKAMAPTLQAKAQAYARDAGELARQRRLAAVQSEALIEAESARADRAPEAAGQVETTLADRPPGPPVTAPLSLLSPTTGALVRRFGDTLAGGDRANGVTLAAPRGSRVLSPGAGAVQYVGPVKGWGDIAILRLAGGYHLVLAGLERTSVEVGQSVAAGQPVGWVPDGRQSTSELYLEVRDQGTPVDPARWLDRK